jgi:hypothetical protein
LLLQRDFADIAITSFRPLSSWQTKGDPMKARLRSAALCAVVLTASGLAAVSQATNYSLWVNGRTGGGQSGNYADFTYWGAGTTAAGVNKKSVNWDGHSHISDQNYLVRNALDCYCTGSTGATSPPTAPAT